MSTWFNRIVRAGVTDLMTREVREETKLINSLSFHSILLSAASVIAAVIFVPEHAPFALAAAMLESVAKACVILFNYLQRHLVAKIIFTYITLIVFVMVILYTGLEGNFQYMILTTFFGLIFVYKSGSTENFVLSIVYLVLGCTACGYIYVVQPPAIITDFSDLRIVQLISFSMNVTLIIIMAVIFNKALMNRRAADQYQLHEVSKVATILNTISTNMSDGIFKSHPDQGLIYVNKAFVSIFGYRDEQEMIDQSPEVLYDNVTNRNKLIREIKAEKQVVNRLTRYKRKNGEEFWGRLSCRLIEEDEDEFIVGTVTDVNNEYTQELLLQESEKQLKEAQQIARLGNWQLEITTKKLTWSAEASSIHGYSPSQIPDAFDHWLEQLDNVSPARVETWIAKTMMTKEPIEFSSWYTTPENERKFLVYISRFKRLPTAKGGIWYGTVQDYTEQKQAELKITETQEFYERVLDNIPIEAVMLDEEGRYTYMSQNAISDPKLREWIIGKRNFDYAQYRGLEPEFAAMRDKHVLEALENNTHVQWRETMTRKDGSLTYHVRNLFPVSLRSGELQKRALIGFSFSLNEIMETQQKLEETNAELTRLTGELDHIVYSISHDLRAPIAAVLGLIEVSHTAATPEELEHIHTMQRQTLERLDQYVRDVIDYTRNKRRAVANEPVTLLALVDTCLNDLKLNPLPDDVELVTHIDDRVVNTDPLRLKIILTNLLSNAVKFRDVNKKQHRIELSLRVIDSKLNIRVSDNGIGIKEEYLHRIWEMFFRVNEENHGSGLGLYILNESVNMLQGSVEARSNEGEGSTFEVKIPVGA